MQKLKKAKRINRNPESNVLGFQHISEGIAIEAFKWRLSLAMREYFMIKKSIKFANSLDNKSTSMLK